MNERRLPASLRRPGRCRSLVGTTPSAPLTGRAMTPGARPTPTGNAPVTPTPRVRIAGPPAKAKLLVIGASTGGPDAPGVVLAGLPRDFSAPILITQHMPSTFTELLAATLDRATPFTVREAKHGDVAKSGCAYIAPGGSHMVITDRLGTIGLNDDPPEHNCRPSVDVLFRSAAATFGRACVAVVLTGMGSDGALGAAGLADLGAHVIAQDRDTSVVWGMPGAVAQRDAADQILPLKEIATAISLQFKRNVPSSTASRRAPSSV
ncbi:MAG: CheB methylesterase domain-containing protein [Acidimicrobiales bacterium]